MGLGPAVDFLARKNRIFWLVQTSAREGYARVSAPTDVVSLSGVRPNGCASFITSAQPNHHIKRGS